MWHYTVYMAEQRKYCNIHLPNRKGNFCYKQNINGLDHLIHNIICFRSILLQVGEWFIRANVWMHTTLYINTIYQQISILFTILVPFCPSHYPEIPWVSLTLLPFLRHCTPFSDLPPTSPSVKPHQFTPPLGGLDLALVVMTIIQILLILEQMQRGLRQKEKRIWG